MVPAFLLIDVEPDAHAPTMGDRSPWTGFGRMVERIDELRAVLRRRSGTELNPTWFLRMDPFIEACFGRADFVAHRHASELETILARGDAIGIHPHAHRWSAEVGVFSDYADASWAAHCVRASAATFTETFGERPLRCRQGGFFLHEAVVDAAVAAGVRVDCTPEPGLAPVAHNPSFGVMATAPSTDFRAFPRHPYRPSRGCVGRIGTEPGDERPLTVIPLSSFDCRRVLSPVHRRVGRRLLRRPSRPTTLNPWRRWPSPAVFWDLVDRSIDDVALPYVAVAVRTHDPGSPDEVRTLEILSALGDHPISRRLSWCDPLTADLEL